MSCLECELGSDGFVELGYGLGGDVVSVGDGFWVLKKNTNKK